MAFGVLHFLPSLITRGNSPVMALGGSQIKSFIRGLSILMYILSFLYFFFVCAADWHEHNNIKRESPSSRNHPLLIDIGNRDLHRKHPPL